jgi:hypothetical protein
MITFKAFMEGYKDLSPQQQAKVANRIQMALMQRQAKKTGDKIDDAAMKWITKRGKQFRDKLERGDFDKMIDRMETDA